MRIALDRLERDVRRLLVAAALIVAPSFHAPVPADAQSTDVVIRVGTGPNDQSAPLVYADRMGLFKKAGLDVELSRQPSTPVEAAAIAGGSLDIGQGSTLGTIVLVAKSLPFTVIGNLSYFNSSRPDYALLVGVNSPITSAKDLEGKTFATSSLQDMNSVATLLWLEQHGVDTSTVKRVEIPPSAGLAAIEADRIQATTVYEPFYSAYVASGKVRVLGSPYESMGKRFSTAVLFADAKWAELHRDELQRFMRVVQQAAAYVSTHEDEVSALTAEFVGLDPAAAKNVHHPERGVIVTANDLQTVIDTAAKFKIIPANFPAQSMICSCAPRT